MYKEGKRKLRKRKHGVKVKNGIKREGGISVKEDGKIEISEVLPREILQDVMNEQDFKAEAKKEKKTRKQIRTKKRTKQ